MHSKVYAIFLIFTTTLGAAIAGKNPNYGNGRSEQDLSSSNEAFTDTRVSTPKKWISQLFQEAERNFSMHPNVTTECRKDMETYALHLQNQSVWAVRMMESSEWPVVGVFYGRNYHVGNWQECLLANGPGVKGKYCLVEAKLDFLFHAEASHGTSKWVDWPNETASAWSVIEMYKKQAVRTTRQRLHWAICMPSSCTNSDLIMSLNSTLRPTFQQNGINITVGVDPRLCSREDTEHYSPGHDLTWMLFGGIMLLVVISSTYDLSRSSFEGEIKKQSFWADLFKCFSVKYNYETLTRTTRTTYPLIYAIKFVYMFLAIYAHRIMYNIGGPITEAEEVEMTYKPVSIELVNDGMVDIFFMISGFLTLFLGIGPMTKGGLFYMGVSIIARWIRMIPLLILLGLFAVYILPFLGSGPLWDHRIMKEIDICKASWWTHLLAINNIVEPQNQCLIVSYYIAIDIQLFVLGSILLYIITKNEKIGLALMILTIVITSATTFIVTYLKHYSGHIILSIDLATDPRSDKEFISLYISTYSRVGPYLIGFMAALLAIIFKKRNIKFTKIQTLVIISVTAAIGLGSQYYAFEFYKLDEPYRGVEHASFAALHRLLFALSYAISISIYVTTGLAKSLKMFEHVIFVVLGRLVYGALLVSFVLQLYLTASQRQPLSSYGRFRNIKAAISDADLAFIIAFFVYLTLEGPINNILKLVLSKLFKSRKPENNEMKPTKVVCQLNGDLAARVK